MTMRTNIVIDDKLMADAFKATGARTKRELVEMGLRALVQRKQGVTVSKTTDAIIATFCIEERLPLLYSDRDFDPFVAVLGLRRVKA